MIRIGQNEKDVLEKADKVLLIEDRSDMRLWLWKVVDQNKANGEASVGYISHGMFESPNYAVNDELELRWRQFQ